MAGRLDMSLEPRGVRRAAVLRGDRGAAQVRGSQGGGSWSKGPLMCRSQGAAQARSFEFSVA